MNLIAFRLTQRTCGYLACCSSRYASVFAASSTAKEQKEKGSRSKKRKDNQSGRRQDIADTFGLLAGPNIEQAHNIRHFKKSDRHRTALVKDYDGIAEDNDDEVDVDSGRPETVGFLVRKHDAEWYGHQCDNLAKEGKIAECVAMLERRMLVEDNVQPVAYNFNVVLRAVAPLGHVRTAISLYEKMCELGVPISRTALTYIYNTCANAKPVDGRVAIACAEEVRAATAKRGYQPERIHFCTLIKLYARHGTYEDARRIFAQMIHAGYPAEVDAYCNLLQACVNDRNAGSGPAIQIFQSLLKDGQRPTLGAFNLLLRVLRDCRFADDFQLLSLNDGKSAETFNFEKQLVSKTVNDNASSEIADQATIAAKEMRPSLTPSDPTSQIVPTTTPLSQLTAQQRFRAIGGIESFLGMMKSTKVKPDIRIFSQMVDLIERDEASESDLLRLMEERYQLSPDVPFLNALIKRRAARGAFDEAIKCLDLITKYRLNPDEKTFGCLALGCRTTRDGKELLRSMLAAGIKPNMPVLDALITTAIRHFNFDLATFVVAHIAKHRLRVDRRFIADVHSAMTSCSQILTDQKPSFPANFATNYRDFRMLLLKTLPEVKLVPNVNVGDSLQERVEKVDPDALRNAEEKPWATTTPKYQ